LARAGKCRGRLDRIDGPVPKHQFLVLPAGLLPILPISATVYRCPYNVQGLLRVTELSFVFLWATGLSFVYERKEKMSHKRRRKWKKQFANVYFNPFVSVAYAIRHRSDSLEIRHDCSSSLTQTSEKEPTLIAILGGSKQI
jgi:hypothetical protein